MCQALLLLRWIELYEFSEKLAELVQTARIAHGLTQDELAEYIGVTGKSISNIERGVANPEFGTIYAIFRRLRIDANAVFYPENEEDTSLEIQFRRLLASCSQDELKMLLSINDTLLTHLRKNDTFDTATV